MTLAELINTLEEIAEVHGDDAEVIITISQTTADMNMTFGDVQLGLFDQEAQVWVDENEVNEPNDDIVPVVFIRTGRGHPDLTGPYSSPNFDNNDSLRGRY